MSPNPPADRLIGSFLRRGTRPFRIPGWTWRAWGPRTIELGLWQLNTFHAWAQAQTPPLDLLDATRDDLEAFVWYLEHKPAASGRGTEPWSPSAVQGMVQTLRRFYAWLEVEGDLVVEKGEVGPARWLQAGRPVPEGGPGVRQHKITEAEHRALVAACPRSTLAGRRSAAILWTFWSTGMRRAELHELNLDDLVEGYLRFGHVKGGGRGMVDVEPEALDAIERYLDKRRPDLDGEPALFVTLDHHDLRTAKTRKGQPRQRTGYDRRRLGLEAISATVREASARAQSPRVHACHEYRRTRATEEAALGAQSWELEALFGWRPGSKMARRYLGADALEKAAERQRARRRAAADRSRKRRSA